MLKTCYSLIQKKKIIRVMKKAQTSNIQRSLTFSQFFNLIYNFMILDYPYDYNLLKICVKKLRNLFLFQEWPNLRIPIW